jgi:phosphatidylglycerol:prolipoprotein diacylglycerol transferase
LFPILIDLGPLQLPAYGVLMATAFLIGLKLFQSLGRREGIDADRITTLWVWILVGGIVGAKLGLFVVEWRYYLRDPSALLRSWRAAGVYYAGFLAAVVTALIYVRRNGLPLGRTADITAPVLALGQSVGRVGCLAAGCCYGRVTDVPWAITFHDPRAAAITGVPLGQALHPTQFYLSLNALALSGLLLLLWRLRRARGWPAGIVFWSYVALYSGSRFVLEYFRDDPRGSVGSLSTSQFIGIFGVVVGLAGLTFVLRRPQAESA